MKTPTYLSPTSLGLWISDRTAFYTQYLAEHRPLKAPQTVPMALGSGFDAFVKAYLYKAIYGNEGKDAEKIVKEDPITRLPHVVEGAEFNTDRLFRAQVDPHLWDRVHPIAAHIFQEYKSSGALATLLMDMQNCTQGPRFEFTIEKGVTHQSTVEDIVPMLGKPDIWFVNKEEMHIILDWKVNSYFAARGISPAPGYILDSKTRKHHRDAVLMKVKGLMINIAHTLDTVDSDWARQLSMYAWIMGEDVGSDFVCGIDQLMGAGYLGLDPSGKEILPEIRVASFRSRVSKEFQFQVFGAACACWRAIQRGPEFIFEDQGLNRRESADRCAMLEDQYKAFDPNDPQARLYMNLIKGDR